MGAKHQKQQAGFTIIELGLFLGITGLLALALLGGWTTMINTQRYRDSVKTLQSFLQDQYTLVYNVENGRNDDLTCVNGVVNDGPGPGIQRGQSDCILMGRYIYIENGSKLTVWSISGKDDVEDDNDNDLDSINERDPLRVEFTLGLTNNELNVPWSAGIVKEDGSPRSVAVAIIRSPLSGVVHTFSKEVTGALPLVDELLAAGETDDVNLCLDPGTPLTGGRMGVVIKAPASSQSFVQTISDGDNVCQPI